MSEINKMNDNDKRWKDHSDFLADFAGNIAYLLVTFESGNSREKIESVEHLVKTLSFSAFRHAEKHLLEDFDNGLIESGNGSTESGNVVDEPLVNDISVSGDRVKRSTSNIGSSWDKAKREPHVYENADSVSNENIDNESVITSQDECAKRFAEGEAVRRNYAGIND